MTPVFADTFYFLALVNPDDQAHEQALAISSPLRWPLVTTYWVLAELGTRSRRHTAGQAFPSCLVCCGLSR